VLRCGVECQRTSTVLRARVLLRSEWCQCVLELRGHHAFVCLLGHDWYVQAHWLSEYVLRWQSPRRALRTHVCVALRTHVWSPAIQGAHALGHIDSSSTVLCAWSRQSPSRACTVHWIEGRRPPMLPFMRHVRCRRGLGVPLGVLPPCNHPRIAVLLPTGAASGLLCCVLHCSAAADTHCCKQVSAECVCVCVHTQWAVVCVCGVSISLSVGARLVITAGLVVSCRRAAPAGVLGLCAVPH
jgi:hypothetical protein